MLKRASAVLMFCGIAGLLPTVPCAAPASREAALRAFIDAPANNIVRTQRANGSVDFLGADPRHPIPEASLLRRPEDRAHAFLKSNRNLFVDAATALELTTTRVQDNDRIGISHVRVQQLFHGIPVRNAEAVVRLNAAGITAVSSKLISTPTELPTAPLISSDAALSTAQSVVLKKYGPVPATLNVPQLEILDVGLFHGQPGRPQLTWYITAGGDALYERIWINAVSGALTYNYSQITEARNRRTFDGKDGSIISSTPARSEGQGPTDIADVDNTFDAVGDFWDYFFTVQGRDSYDGAGATLNSIVRYCNTSTGCPFKGAYWDGNLTVQRIFLGTGFTTDDVIAHELTHAVIDYTSNLVYSGESGALNESYADIFGETIDLWNGKGDDSPNVRWVIGEELPGYLGIGIRNLFDPTLRGQPGRVTDANYLCDSADNFRVHNNSGVPNHAFALMVDGGNYNGYSVKGIGLDKAAKIQYWTLLLLPSASSLADNFNGLNQACSELIGTDGITHEDCAQVKTAALAVEMTTPPCPKGAIPPAPPDATPAPVAAAASQCPVGQVVQYVYAENFETTNSGNWLTSAASGANHWLGGTGTPAIYFSTNPAGGSFALHGSAAIGVADSSVMMKSDVLLPAKAKLQFAGSYDFETGFDGGVIEYSLDAGGSWQDAGALITAGRNYDGVLLNGASNPLSGRAAFTGHTGTYVNSQLDLSSLATRAIRFRFRIGTDKLVASPGWSIDNLSIYGCATTTGGITIAPTQGLQTNEAGGTANFSVVLTAAPTANVTLTLTSSNTREGSVTPSVVTFTPANWNVAKTVTVTGVDDSVDDGDAPYSVLVTGITSTDPSYNNLVAPSVNLVNVDNDDSALLVTPSSSLVTTEAGGTTIFTVALRSQPSAEVTLSISSSNRREGNVSSTTETFTATNWNQARSITIKGVDDNITDGNMPYYVAINVASSADQHYAALGEVRVNVTNLDNDQARFIVTPNAGLATSESGGQATVLVRLSSQPTAAVSLNLTSSNPAEGKLAPATLTFLTTNWDIPQAVVVTGVDDAIADGNVQYTVLLNPAVSTDRNYNGLDAPDLSIVNIDNDVANILITPGTNVFTTETGGVATFTLALSKAPAGNVSIGLTSSKPGEGLPNRSTIVFTASNWNLPTTVTVAGIDDNALDGDVLYSIITAPAISGDIAYNGMNPPDVFLINRDNDTAAILVDPVVKLSTTESGGIATFSVTLARPPNANVNLAVSSSNPAEGVVTSQSQLQFTAANWNIPQKVTVTGVNDNFVDGDVEYNVEIDPSGSDDANYWQLPALNVALVNRDNEKQPVQPSDSSVLIKVNAPKILFTKEAGETTFTVTLSRPPTDQVTITVESSNTKEATVDPVQFTFTAIDWDKPKTVRVHGVDDREVEPDVPYEIVLDAADSADFDFAASAPFIIEAVNKDNDKVATGAFGVWFLALLWSGVLIRRRMKRCA